MDDVKEMLALMERTPLLRYKVLTFLQEFKLENRDMVLGKVLKWLRSRGGLDVMERMNTEKAGLLYDALDARLVVGAGGLGRRLRGELPLLPGRPLEAEGDHPAGGCLAPPAPFSP